MENDQESGSSNVKEASGNLGWTTFAKQVRADKMLVRGRHFIGAALLVQREHGDRLVVLHLFCQGAELIMKAALLFIDFDGYSKRTRRLGHDLEKIARMLRATCRAKYPPDAVRTELRTLSQYYKSHVLRYGSFYVDILKDPDTIPLDHTIRYAFVLDKWLDRKLRRVGVFEPGKNVVLRH